VSIVGQVNVESRRYSGWIDPRYPIGYWQGSLDLTGDASAGVAGLDLVFQQANGGDRLNSQMYSVERYSVSTSDAVSRNARLSVLNMGGPSNLGFRNLYTVEVQNIAGGQGTAVRTRDALMVPWFLGSQRSAGTTASLSLIIDNVDGVIYHLEAEGYRWSPRSVLVDGGPQRPPTGLYRA